MKNSNLVTIRLSRDSVEYLANCVGLNVNEDRKLLKVIKNSSSLASLFDEDAVSEWVECGETLLCCFRSILNDMEG
jgi:hypothetical protein